VRTNPPQPEGRPVAPQNPSAAPPPPPPPPALPRSTQAVANAVGQPGSRSHPRTEHQRPHRMKQRLARLALSLIVVVLAGLGGSVLIPMIDSDEVPPASAAAAPLIDDPSAACGAQPPPQPPRPGTLPKPQLTLPRGEYVAVVHTSCGDMKIDLLGNRAPKAVANFIYLANAGFYNGLVWHQVIPDALIQTGDPNGYTGVAPDDAGYTIRDELPREAFRYTFGHVGMANTGKPDTSGSQFFIVTHGYGDVLAGNAPALEVPSTYTVFGRVRPRYIGSLHNIASQPVIGGDDQLLRNRPQIPVYVERIEIHRTRSNQ